MSEPVDIWREVRKLERERQEYIAAASREIGEAQKPRLKELQKLCGKQGHEWYFSQINHAVTHAIHECRKCGKCKYEPLE